MAAWVGEGKSLRRMALLTVDWSGGVVAPPPSAFPFPSLSPPSHLKAVYGQLRAFLKKGSWRLPTFAFGYESGPSGMCLYILS